MLVFCSLKIWLLHTLKKIVRNMIHVTSVYSREIMNMFAISQISGLVKNFNIENVNVNVRTRLRLAGMHSFAHQFYLLCADVGRVYE